MIILPDRNISRAKFLLPVLKKEWREPSQAMSKDQFGNPIFQTRFRIRAKTHDGVILWAGWFDDREEFDAFLYAIFLGTLPQEKSLWNLPTPMWSGLDMGLVYDFATVSFLTGPTASLQTYNRPGDWRDNGSLVECLGAGGRGGWVNATASTACGGGGGAYTATPNISLGATASYQIGAGGGDWASNSGGDTWFNGADLASSSVGAKGGSVGNATVGGTSNGGSGGSATNSIGTTKYAGGKGGNCTATVCASGGGGAASSVGAGGAAPNVAGGQVGGDGGASGSGISGGTGISNNVLDGDVEAGFGQAGTEWDATHGSGSGGGGIKNNTGTGSTISGQGGMYGGAGGGANGGSTANIVALGGGKQGIIVITYNPLIRGFNMPFLGL